MTKRKKEKNLNILRTKRVFKMKQKALSITFKGLSVNQIKHIFLKGKIQTLNKSKYTLGIFIDLSKAFNTVYREF